MLDSNRTYYSHEAEQRAERERINLIVVCLMVGLGIGSVMAMLFAPTEGKKLRKDLRHTVEESVHNGRDRIEPAVASLEKEIRSLRKIVEERLN